MSQLYYQHPMRYETFIRRAYTSGKEHYSFFMESLIAYETMPTLVELYEIQLGKVKGYLEKALNKFLNLDLEEDERTGLIRLKEDLESAYTSSRISDVVIRGLGLTDRFKPA